MAFQIGADVATDRITVAFARHDRRVPAWALRPSLAAGSIERRIGSPATISNLDVAIDEVTSARSNLGSVQNRFESVVANPATSQEKHLLGTRPHHRRGTSRSNRRTCRGPRCSRRRATRCWPRPTSSRSGSCRCCADPVGSGSAGGPGGKPGCFCRFASARRPARPFCAFVLELRASFQEWCSWASHSVRSGQWSRCVFHRQSADGDRASAAQDHLQSAETSINAKISSFGKIQSDLSSLRDKAAAFNSTSLWGRPAPRSPMPRWRP